MVAGCFYLFSLLSSYNYINKAIGLSPNTGNAVMLFCNYVEQLMGSEFQEK